jgi:hypothetical protein
MQIPGNDIFPSIFNQTLILWWKFCSEGSKNHIKNFPGKSLRGWTLCQAMKYVIFFMFPSIFFFLACQKKAIPVITERSSTFSIPKIDTANLVPDPESGRILFTNRCDKCHGLPAPAQFTEKKWETIVALMAPRARLNNQEYVDVLAYVKTHAYR